MSAVPSIIPVRQRQPREKHTGRLAFIRSLHCCVCFAPPPNEAAHIRMGLGGGMGAKPNDCWTVPLCRRCHEKQHGAGEVAFWRDEISVNKPLLVSILRGYAESLKP